MDYTSLANLSLSALSHNQFTADLVTDNSVLGKTCKTFLDVARREVLAEHNWRFATTMLRSKGRVDDRMGGYHHDRTEAMLRIISVHKANRDFSAVDNGTYDDQGLKWSTGIDGGLVLNEYEVMIRHIYDHEDINRWPPLFQSAVSYRLAFHIAVPLTKSVKAKQAMLQAFADSVGRAIAADVDNSSDQDGGLWQGSPASIEAREHGNY